MKNIIKIKTLEDLQQLYDRNAFVLEDCGDRPLEYLLERYGEESATGYVFTGELIYKACGLPETSSLPKDRVYLAIIPDKEIYEDEILISLISLIWRYSNDTGFNALEQNRPVEEEVEE